MGKGRALCLLLLFTRGFVVWADSVPDCVTATPRSVEVGGCCARASQCASKRCAIPGVGIGLGGSDDAVMVTSRSAAMNAMRRACVPNSRHRVQTAQRATNTASDPCNITCTTPCARHIAWCNVRLVFRGTSWRRTMEPSLHASLGSWSMAPSCPSGLRLRCWFPF